MTVWNTGDTWHLEATGDGDGSRFVGKIIADSPIADLTEYWIEGNDRIEFADNSNQILEFDLTIWSKWTDGISFKVSDGTSLVLDLEDNNDYVSVKAGANFQEVNV